MKTVHIIVYLAAFALAASSCNLVLEKDRNYNFVPDDTNPTDNAPIVVGDWQIDTIVPGAVWKKFAGRDTEITKENQMVNVMEIDLTNPRLHVKFHYGNTAGEPGDLTAEEVRKLTGRSTLTAGDGRKHPEDVFAYARDNEGAICCVNGAYEAGSVYEKTNGETHAVIGCSYIPSHKNIRQWKSEACIVSDGDQKVEIQYASPNAWDYETQRQIYSRMTDWPNLFSSSPMLINDYDPVGSTFVKRMKASGYWSTNNSENPVYHQTTRHPRTVAALVEDNEKHEGCDKLLLITIDGRWNAAVGMSADETTRFIAHHFNPRYALNMDGGGSTCMVILGRGDVTNNVVNYPCQDDTFDHLGTRPVNSHFYVTYDAPLPETEEGGE